MLILLAKANSTEWLSLVLSNNLHCGPHANVGRRLETFNVFTFVIEKRISMKILSMPRGLLKLHFETRGLLLKTYGFCCKQKRPLDANSMGESVMGKQLEQQVMGWDGLKMVMESEEGLKTANYERNLPL